MQKTLLIAGLTILLGSIAYLQNGTESFDMKAAEFSNYKTQFGKSYSSYEDAYRMAIYFANVADIEAHNADQTQTYKRGINQFTDITQEEFVATYLTFKTPEGWVPPTIEELEAAERQETNDSADWSGYVTVKNQGSCGSCWAFSATGAVEAFQRVKKSVTVSLSEQQLVDCDTSSSGCNGGYPDLAIKYTASHGSATESAYAYKGVKGTCKGTSYTKYNSGYSSVSASGLQAAIKAYPVSVCVDATNWSSYSSGTFSNCNKSINHAVLAVGFQSDGTWIIKNSWGTSWGQKGFLHLKSGDTCGVTQYATKAT